MTYKQELEIYRKLRLRTLELALSNIEFSERTGSPRSPKEELELMIRTAKDAVEDKDALEYDAQEHKRYGKRILFNILKDITSVRVSRRLDRRLLTPLRPEPPVMPTLTRIQKFFHPVVGHFYYDTRGNKINSDQFLMQHVAYEVSPNMIWEWRGCEATQKAWWDDGHKRWVLY